MKRARPVLACTVLAAVILSALPVHAASEGGWPSISEEGLTVRYRDGSRVLAEQVMERAVKFLGDTSAFLGLPWMGRYTIIIANSRQEFKDLQPTSRPAPEWAGALTYPGLGLVLLMSPGAMQSGGQGYWSLLQHEMAHLLLGDAEIRNDVQFPRWFQEGIATYVSGEMGLGRLLQLGWAQATGATPRFRDLEFNFPARTSHAEAAYARSYLFIHYLNRRFGEDAVSRLIAASLSRGGLERGVVEAFGTSLGELLAGFDQYARVRATWIPLATSTASIWVLITLLFFITWFRKKVEGMRTMRRWEMEEKGLDPDARDEESRSDESRTLH